MKIPMWLAGEALVLVQNLGITLAPEWGVGLAGSILHRGFSEKDVDIIIFPARPSSNIQELYPRLENFGLLRIKNRQEVQEGWCLKGSEDAKHVERWSYMGKRVDLFFLK